MSAWEAWAYCVSVVRKYLRAPLFHWDVAKLLCLIFVSVYVLVATFLGRIATGPSKHAFASWRCPRHWRSLHLYIQCAAANAVTKRLCCCRALLPHLSSLSWFPYSCYRPIAISLARCLCTVRFSWATISLILRRSRRDGVFIDVVLSGAKLFCVRGVKVCVARVHRQFASRGTHGIVFCGRRTFLIGACVPFFRRLMRFCLSIHR